MITKACRKNTKDAKNKDKVLTTSFLTRIFHSLLLSYPSKGLKINRKLLTQGHPMQKGKPSYTAHKVALNMLTLGAQKGEWTKCSPLESWMLRLAYPLPPTPLERQLSD